MAVLFLQGAQEQWIIWDGDPKLAERGGGGETGESMWSECPSTMGVWWKSPEEGGKRGDTVEGGERKQIFFFSGEKNRKEWKNKKRDEKGGVEDEAASEKEKAKEEKKKRKREPGCRGALPAVCVVRAFQPAGS